MLHFSLFGVAAQIGVAVQIGVAAQIVRVAAQIVGVAVLRPYKYTLITIISTKFST